jgi:hypothetical protein
MGVSPPLQGMQPDRLHGSRVGADLYTPPGRRLEGSRRVWDQIEASDCQQLVSNDPTHGLASHHGASCLNPPEHD